MNVCLYLAALGNAMQYAIYVNRTNSRTGLHLPRCFLSEKIKMSPVAHKKNRTHVKKGIALIWRQVQVRHTKFKNNATIKRNRS